MFHRLRSLLRRPPRPPAPIRADVFAYCGSWVDETWIRTTVSACRRRDLRVVLAVSGDTFDAAGADAHRRQGVDLRLGADRDLLARIEAPVLLSATTSIQDLAFHETVRARVHMPHSLASLHMIYPDDAFDGFDVLFASGPHHVREFSALSAHRGRGDRPSLAVGYGKLDILRAGAPAPGTAGGDDRPHVVVAPSWGPGNLLEAMGPALCAALLDDGWRVTLRPHPAHCAPDDPRLRAVTDRCAEHAAFSVERSTEADASLHVADVMISDYSGVAFEFAALRRRPCVFVEGTPKELNPEWRELGLAPVEVALRERLGRVVDADVHGVRDATRAVYDAGDGIDDSCLDAFLFDDGPCAERAADHLEALRRERL
ncbi:MAG: CDP-glycerol glycerophosphotransferase family protein [Planctomycetota bacterium]|jgi:hypothetical protein